MVLMRLEPPWLSGRLGAANIALSMNRTLDSLIILIILPSNAY
jgi:hypothetical protein